jgi:signal transduction histidine kinase
MVQSAAGESGDTISRRFQPKLIASLDRAIKLCNDTLRYGRAEEAAPLRETVGLSDMVADVGDGLGLPRTTDGRLSLDWQMRVPDDLSVKADPEQLFRILNNLVRNAVQALETPAGPKGGQISIVAARTTDGVTVTVSDNGPGVPEKAKATLFQAFQTTNRVGGSGLGLAIAAELVAAHGGRLSLVDTATGSGASFQFNLPDDTA